MNSQSTWCSSYQRVWPQLCTSRDYRHECLCTSPNTGTLKALNPLGPYSCDRRLLCSRCGSSYSGRCSTTGCSCLRVHSGWENIWEEHTQKSTHTCHCSAPVNKPLLYSRPRFHQCLIILMYYHIKCTSRVAGTFRADSHSNHQTGKENQFLH